MSMLFVLTASSFLICLLIISLKDRFTFLGGRPGDLISVQAAHSAPTPRVGGLAIFGSLGLGILSASFPSSSPYPDIFLATSLLFAVGLLEDIGYRVSPTKRLLAAALCSLIVIAILGKWMPRADIPGLDALIGHWAIGVPLTVLITAGIANAFNLIDGVNGLAGLAGLAACLALSLIGAEAEYERMTYLSLMLAASILGFYLLNYPFGLIFLGDAGAYTIGFVLSWFCISILIEAPSASPWALLLTVYWPVFDMLVAIYRRLSRRTAAMSPDRLHIHQVVMRALEMCVLGRHRRRLSNPLTTLILAPFVVAPPAVGVLFWDQSQLALVAVIAFTLLNLVLYVAAEPGIRRFRRSPAFRIM